MGRLLAVAIWVITIASVLMFFNKRWWFPEAITDHGPTVDRQFIITIIVCGIAFAAAQIGLGWVVWKYRDSADKARATYSHGNNRLEVVWTIVTAIVFISLAVMGQRVWAALHLNPAPAGATQIEVTAQQFAWNIRYAGPDNIFGRTDVQYIDDATNPVGLVDTDQSAEDDVVGPTLVIPVNRPVELILKSKDVTHNFWVPQLRFKQDLVPGMAIRVHFTVNKVGKYELACAELCGMNHFKMKTFMLVLPAADFDALVQMTPAQFQDKKNELLNSYQLPQY
jgi:cytochrome c oxidase subunit II